ncbi:MAG: hypothetical protein AB7K24_23915 [Gemmataceae bacterium]
MITSSLSPWRGLFLGTLILLVGCGKNEPGPMNNPNPNPAPDGKIVIKEELVEPELVIDGLSNSSAPDLAAGPCGVAVQPGTGHLFVTMNGRIGRVVPGKDAKLIEEVVEFPVDKYGKGPIYELGPLGAAFLDENTLVVGGGELPDGQELVRFYSVGKEPAVTPKKADEMLKAAGPIAPGADSVKGEGNFYAVAVKGNTIFVTCNGDDTKGWVSKVEWDKEKPSPLPLTPYIKTKVATQVDAPTGITIGPQGELVVSQLGEITQDKDSLLTFYDAASGKLINKHETGLNDLCGLAYSPKTGKLYGVDFSWSDPSKGGLYRLEVVGDKVQPTRIATLERPTALAFAPDGTLYVTIVGSAKEGKPGQLIAFKGL